MKKKPTNSDSEPVADQDFFRQANLAVGEGTPRTASRCVICGSDAAPTSTENLCWVCRRLKISAWRDSDPQMMAQE